MTPTRLSAVLCGLSITVFLRGVGLMAEAAQPDLDGAALVQRLGHGDCRLREEAEQRLESQGMRVRNDLVAGMQAEDPEVRRRCRRILARLLDSDYRQRIANLLADQTGGHHDLPGWSWYRQVVGNHDQARRSYAAMLLAEPGLFAAAGRGAEPMQAAFETRLAHLYRHQTFPDPRFRRQADVESVAALLLVAAHPEWNLPGRLVDHPQLFQFVHGGDFAAALNRGMSSAAVRRLVGCWMLVSGVPHMVQQKLRLALQHEIREGLPLAMGMLAKAETLPPSLVAIAAEATARLGGRQHAAALLPLLADARQCLRSGNRTIEVRDVALAWLAHATGQDLEAYGQPTAKGWFQTVAQKPGVMFNFSQFGYENPEQRSEALARWTEWIAAHPLPALPESPPLVADRPAGSPPSSRAADASHVPPSGALAMADRDLVRHLRDAERLSAIGQYSAAVAILGRLLALDGDFYFQPDRDAPVFRHLKSAAEDLLGRLPEAGRAAYELQFGAEARRRLDAALRAGDRLALARVSHEYFHAEAGAEAAYLVGAAYWREGQWFSAAACWQRLAETGTHARRFEPALSFQLASCWLALNEPLRATERLEWFRTRHAGAATAMAGRRVQWYDDKRDAPAWLAKRLGHASSPVDSSWGLARGRPSGNPLVESGGPYLAGSPIDAFQEDSLVQDVVQRAGMELAARRRAALPTLQPVVIGDRVVSRSATSIRAVHVESGELLWEARPDDALAGAIVGGRNGERTRSLLMAELPDRLWRNQAHGALSTDGRLVFAVERLPVQELLAPQQMAVGRDGDWRLEWQPVRNAGMMTAYDAATGKLRWEAGGASADEERPLAGVGFLGPPLPLGASLYCIAETREGVVLLALDSATGKSQWQRVLAVRDEHESHRDDGVDENGGHRLRQPGGATGASPSYAEGTLVCPFGGGAVAAVDLASRNVLWIHQTHDAQEDPLAEQRRIRVPQTREQADSAPPDEWTDARAIVADGCVLLALPATDLLACLSLADGVQRWTAPREDGLFVGGVHEGVVLVVGRGGARGLRLTDGEPAWPDPALLPPGAMPSGRGFLADGRLFVPLTTAEVLAVDASTGRIVSRSRSPAGIVPGNLAGLPGGVVSQSIQGIWRFDLTADLEARAAERLAEAPEDAAAWRVRGELLLCEGRIAEAVECLLHARRLDANAPVQMTLARAVTDGLWGDYDRYRPFLKSVPLEELDPGQRASVLRAIGWSAQRAGDRATALDAYLNLAQVDSAPDALQPISAALHVRRDRWLAARLDELLHGDASEPSVAADRFASLPDEMRIRYLPFHAATIEAWTRAGARWAAGNAPFAAEQDLRAALWHSQPDAAPEATAQLTALLLQRGRHREALPLLASLAGSLADRTCLHGQTGRQLLEAWSAEHRLAIHGAPQPAWPADALEAETTQRDGRQPVVYHVPVRVHAVEPALDRPANVRIENTGRALSGYDDLGRQTWEVPLKPTGHNVGFRNGHYLAEGAQLGPVLVLWLVTRVCAIDLSGAAPRLLWDCETSSLGAADPRHAHRIQRANLRRAQPAGVQGDVAGPLVLGHGLACFERDGALTAVDPATGSLLWTRDDVPAGVDLFGDARFIFVAPAEGRDARMLSSLDGRDMGRRTLPPRSDWLAAMGRRLLVSESVGQLRRVRLLDASSGETVWERESDAQARVALVRPGHVASLGPDGRFAMWRGDSGQTVLETQLDIPAAAEPLYVEPCGADLLVLVNAATEPAGPRPPVHSTAPAVDANGRLFRIAADGRTLWKADIVDQQLELDLPGELPVLLLGKHRRQQIPRPQGGMTTKVEYAFQCIDKRSGATLCEEVVQGHAQEMEIRAVDPKGGRIEILNRLLSIQITRSNESP